jgi:predicted DNA-binding protein (MmcQ/YjbR family)
VSNSGQEAYHFNKKHWISVKMDEAPDFNRVCKWIDRSYELVLKGVSKKTKRELGIPD